MTSATVAQLSAALAVTPFEELSTVRGADPNPMSLFFSVSKVSFAVALAEPWVVIRS